MRYNQVNTTTMLKEFKNFIMTGNVIDLAVAVILAGAGRPGRVRIH